MTIPELIGRRITNIYGVIEIESYGLDTVVCFIELDGTDIIPIPSGREEHIYAEDLVPQAVPLITDMTDEIESASETIHELASGNASTSNSLLQKMKSLFLGRKTNPQVEHKPQNKPYRKRYIKDRKIADFLWYPEQTYDSGFFVLDNGCIIGETSAAMNGTGLAGLNYYVDIESLIARKGKDYQSILKE
jgi:hypothetical protein